MVKQYSDAVKSVPLSALTLSSYMHVGHVNPILTCRSTASYLRMQQVSPPSKREFLTLLHSSVQNYLFRPLHPHLPLLETAPNYKKHQLQLYGNEYQSVQMHMQIICHQHLQSQCGLQESRYASHCVLHPQAQNPFTEEYGLPLALLSVTVSLQHHIELWDHAQQSAQNWRRI